MIYWQRTKGYSERYFPLATSVMADPTKAAISSIMLRKNKFNNNVKDIYIYKLTHINIKINV